MKCVSLMGHVFFLAQTRYGDIEFGFYPHVAPKTVEHIFKLVRLGCYNTNHFFRVFTMTDRISNVSHGKQFSGSSTNIKWV